jgi:hypothetical protein
MDIKLVLKNSRNSVATPVVPMVNAVFGWADEIKRFRDIQVSLCSVSAWKRSAISFFLDKKNHNGHSSSEDSPLVYQAC